MPPPQVRHPFDHLEEGEELQPLLPRTRPLLLDQSKRRGEPLAGGSPEPLPVAVLAVAAGNPSAGCDIHFPTVAPAVVVAIASEKNIAGTLKPSDLAVGTVEAAVYSAAESRAGAALLDMAVAPAAADTCVVAVAVVEVVATTTPRQARRLPCLGFH